MTCLLKSKIQKIFPYFKDFLNMKLHVLYNTQCTIKTGNAHKNELSGRSNASHPSVHQSHAETEFQRNQRIKRQRARFDVEISRAP